MNKSWLYVLSILAILFLIAMPVGAFSGSGAGTSGDPYQITSYSEMDEMRNANTAYYILMNDIECSGNNWTPFYFGGDFNGHFYKIKHLNIYISDGGYSTGAAFFCNIGGSIRDTVFTDAVVDNYGGGTYTMAATVVGYGGGGTIDGVFVMRSTVKASEGGARSNQYVVGLAEIYQEGVYNSTVMDSTLYSAGTSGSVIIGGVVGNPSNTMRNVAGINNTAIDMNSAAIHAIGSTGGADTSVVWDDDVGNMHASNLGVGITTAEMKSQSYLESVGWDFSTRWEMSDINGEYRGYPILQGMIEHLGAGTSGDPYQISTYDELNDMRYEPYAYYKLMNDIDCAGNHWNPIDMTNVPFQLNGQGYTISNFLVDDSNDQYAGFIGYLNTPAGNAFKTGGVFVNVTFCNATIIGIDSTDGTYNAVLAARIDKSNSYAEIFADRVFIYNSTITRTAGGSQYFGTFIGQDRGATGGNYGSRILNSASYNNYVYDGAYTNAAGAMVGGYYNPNAWNVLDHTWSNVASPAYSMVESVNAGYDTATASYWDNTLGTSGALGSATSTANMKIQGTYSGWDFTDIWKMSASGGVFAGYPIFKWMESTPAAIIPVSSFTKDKTGGTSPVTVLFTDASTNTPTSWFWVFGDGSTTNNTVQSPYHTFSGAGTYNVNLTATNSAGSNTSAIQTVTVGLTPTASFTKDKTGGTSPLIVTFTFTGSGAVSYFWVFGDGDTTNNTQMSPIHTFNGVGTYAVNVTATNTYGSNTTATQVITLGLSPTSSFTKNKVGGTSPVTVTFTDTSSGTPNAWFWVFGDGDTTNNTDQNPIHTFTGAGTYNVDLTASNTYGTGSTTATQSIVVGIPPIASFTKDSTGGLSPVIVSFTDTTTGGTPSSWQWHFGDGNTTSIYVSGDIWHEFVGEGTYNVSLTAINAYGTDTSAIQDIVITELHPPTNANWTANVTSGAAAVPPLVTVEFTAAYLGGVPSAYAWYFNGTFSNAATPIVTFSNPGVFPVNVTVTNSDGASSYNGSYTVVGKAPHIRLLSTIPYPGYATTATNSTFGVAFNLTDYGAPTTYLWTWGDGTTSSTNPAYHIYSVAGTYNGTIRASNVWGYDEYNFTWAVPLQTASVLKWVDKSGNTITSAYTGTNVSFSFNTLSNGKNPPIGYIADYFYLQFYHRDVNTGNWIYDNTSYPFKAMTPGNSAFSDYLTNDGVYGGLYAAGLHSWIGYGEFPAIAAGTYRGQIIAVNITDAVVYPPVVLGYTDLAVTANPIQFSNVGDTSKDVGGWGLNLVIAAIIVLILIAIPFAITRVFNVYIEVFMAVLGIGFGYFLHLIDSWIIVGMVIVAAVIIFFMWKGGGASGGGEAPEGGEVG